MITARAFAGRPYAVYGLARSGLATAKALLASGAQVSAWDSNEEARSKAPRGAELVDLDEVSLAPFESLVVTPGLPLNRHPIAGRAREAGVEIIGDIELFARARPELPPHKVVGITGTNGKSTTTALVHHIITIAGVPTSMGGNIGLPILAQDPLIPNDQGVGIYVLELSSFQIDLMQSLDCDVALLLNVTPDHLDRYESFEAYAESKERLLELSSGVRIRGRDLERLPSQDQWPALQGPHNAQNAAVAVEACQALLLDAGAIEEGLRTFPGLPHRMERVREKEGVLFVNDSKATNPTATAPALAAFPAIRWVLGGRAKTDSLEECEPHFGNVRSAYTIGEAAELFERLLAPHMPVENCGELSKAITRAADDAQAGDTVLLSPACASFDQFRDFEQRGDRFKQFVGAL